MQYKRILTVQDISCLGQCSMTVAMPILSACGLETCILPSAVLSTHTGGFKGFTFRDLTVDFGAIIKHWKDEKISFDAVYTGYLGNSEQVDHVKRIAAELINDGGKLIVDPAMADNGKLYTGFDGAYVEKMRELCAAADVILPNVTEASLLTGSDYAESYDAAYIAELTEKLLRLGAKSVVLTGVGYDAVSTGVSVWNEGKSSYYRHVKIPKSFHGTGDIYSSAFTGMLINGSDICDAAKTAADFTVACIENTLDDPEHWYGVKFEPCLNMLTSLVGKAEQ